MKQTPLPREEIFAIIRSCLADSLALPQERILLTSGLIPDLGVDSLDLLDLIFTLEKKFAIGLRDSDLDRLMRADFAADQSAGSGLLSPAALNGLREWLPALPSGPEAEGISGRSLFSYLTVESLVILVERKLAGTVTASTGP